MHIRRIILLTGASLVVTSLAQATSRDLVVDAARMTRARASAVVSPLAARNASALDLKMNPPLRLLLEQAGVATPEAGAARAASLERDASSLALYRDASSPLYLLPGGAGEAPETFAFARLDGVSGANAVRVAGGTIVRQIGELAIVRAPLAKLAGIAQADAVRHLSLSMRWSAALDSSRVRSRTATVHANTGGALPQAYKGAGVVVGVLDSGLDYTHADFRTPGNLSRVKALLDFSLGTDGTECRPGQLDSLTCPEIDGSGGHGHGTHVTGIAAGNGRRNAAYVGMAPEADLMFVKGIRDAQSLGGFSDADVVNGTGYLFDHAMALGRPAVVNLSLGGQIGAHDGTSLQEQFLDLMTGPGRVVVAAAGNSGAEKLHASYAAEGTDYNSSVESWIELASSSALVDVWAPKTANVSIGLVAYDPNAGMTVLAVSAAAAPGQLLQGTLSTTGGQGLANVTIDARTTQDPNNGDRNILIQIAPSGSGVNPADIVWAIYVFGSGTVDMWAANAVFAGVEVAGPSYWRPGDAEKTIGIPGTGKRIVCVGAHVSKNSYRDLDNVVRTPVPSDALDQVAFFSSHGPSRDGRHLPNFTAPGEVILSALSKDYPAARADVLLGGGLQQQMGTSQASPHVTGITALMLQRDPSLTPENVRTILAQTATVVPASVPDVQGAGRVNALAALQATPDPLGCVVLMPNGVAVPCDQVEGPRAMMAYPNPAHRGAQLRFSTTTRQRVHLALYDVGGRRVRTLADGELEAGPHTIDWDGADGAGRRLASGIYFARMLTPVGTRSIRLVVSR